MRQLKDHMTNPTNEELTVTVLDVQGPGGAHHDYEVFAKEWTRPMDIYFQNGPIAEVGVNGVTHEALLAIVIDRLRCFQKGPYACRENALALTKIEEALHWLHARTRARADRGVEGTSVV
jgi:hypothetical protein